MYGESEYYRKFYASALTYRARYNMVQLSVGFVKYRPWVVIIENFLPGVS